VTATTTTSHYHHLPCFQMRARGGSFRCFNVNPTTTTSLASKRELEVVLFVVSTRHPPSPPPSRPNASQRCFFLSFRRDSHYHHLPRVQMRARGGCFSPSNASATTTTSLVSKRELEVVVFVISTRHPLPPPPSCPNTSRRWLFLSFRCVCPTTTSLTFKREPEEVHFVVSTRLLPPPPPSLPNASQRWFISPCRCDSHHLLPRIQMRAGGGPFQWFQGICCRRHIITARKSIMAKMNKRGRG